MKSDHRFQAPPTRLKDAGGTLSQALGRAARSEKMTAREAQAWNRLEQRLDSVLQPVWRLALGLGLSLTLVALGAVAILSFGDRQNPPDRVAADSSSSSSASAPIRTPTHLGPTPANLPPGRTTLAEGTVAKLSRGGAATVQAPSGGSTRIGLDRGSIELSVVPQGDQRVFDVEAGGYRFRVLGTRFRVALVGGWSQLSVAEGRVAVLTGKQRIAVVDAGHSWKGPRLDATAAAGSVANSTAAAPVSTAQGPQQDCLALAREGKHRQSLSCYERQAAGNGVAAEMALYEIARVRRNVLGDSPGALRALRAYARRFPAGTFHTEVAVSIVELLAAEGRDTQALDASAQLLASGAARERQAELRLLRGRIYQHRLHDCSRAEGEYARVSSLRGPIGAQAQFMRAFCLEAMGRTAAAIEQYQAYLTRPAPDQKQLAQRRLAALTGRTDQREPPDE